MKKKVIILLLILIFIVPLSIVIVPIIKNNNYDKKLLNILYNNTDYKNIIYLNKDNNYYIVKTSDAVLVLDLNYEEKVSIDINEIKEKKLEIVYRRNNLYYEEKIHEEGKIKYKFYNIQTGVLEFEMSLGGI